MRFVLDASVTLCWVLPAQGTHGTDDILRRILSGDEAAAPFIWPVEIIHVLLNAERRRQIAVQDVNQFLRGLGQIQVRIDSQGALRCFDSIIDTARQHDLSGYDAAYLELALRENLPWQPWIRSCGGQPATAA